MAKPPGNPPGHIAEGTMCANCGERPATQCWVGEGGTLAFTHGWWKPWCEACVLDAQIGNIEKQITMLDELRARRKELE